MIRISVDYWTNAEQFYEVWVVILSAMAAIGLMVLLFVLNYSSKETIKRNLVIVLGGIFVLVLIGYQGHTNYEPYLKEAGHINPLIRDRKPTLIGYQYYTTAEQRYYEQLNDKDSLREMALYEEESIIIPITYLGEAGYFHYFEHEDGTIFKQHREVVVKENIQTAQVVGSLFTLKDDAFEEIGFKNPDRIMFERTEISKAEAGKSYQPDNDFNIPTTQEVFIRWNF